MPEIEVVLTMAPPCFFPGRAHGAHQVDVEAAFPALLVVGAAEAGGVVDEPLQTAERLDRAGDEGRDLIGVADVANCGVNLAAVILELAACRFEMLRDAAADGDGRPFHGAGLGDRKADAAGSAGDNDGLAGQTEVHVLLPCCARPSGPAP